MESEILRAISLEELYAHPDNPRKDVGDVTELADSIREQGLLQNLTVVPGHYDSEGNEYDGGYTVIIGHRRRAAAVKAGLKSVPCAVVEMPYSEQIAVMLSENMQRTDLTLTEQAYGMQMMLDLGSTKAEIGEKTGLGKKTVDSRLKLARLPKKEAMQAEAQGATLQQYLEILKLKDEQDQKAVLKLVGKGDYSWEYTRRLKGQRRREREPKIRAALEAEGLKETKVRNARWINEFDQTGPGKNYVEDEYELPKIPEDRKDLYFNFDNDYVWILRKAKKRSNEKSKKEKEAEQARRRYLAFAEECFGMRRTFIMTARMPKEMEKVILMRMMEAIIRREDAYYSANSRTEMKLLIGDESKEYRFDQTKIYRFIADGDAPAKMLWWMLGDAKTMMPYEMNYGEKMPTHFRNERLEKIYGLLEELGYKTGTEEQAWLDGTWDWKKEQDNG